MKTAFFRYVLALALLVISCAANASPQPEGFEGKVSAITAKLITIQNPQGTRVFQIDKAGVCGWPSKKRCIDVFKVGDKVIAYYFGNPAAKRTESALNIFYADEEKVRAFQQGESASKNPAK